MAIDFDPAGYLTAHDLAGCRHRLGLTARYSEALAEVPEDAGAVQRQAAAQQHRQRLRDLLVAADPQLWVVIDATAAPSVAASATLRACAAGTPRIWAAVLPPEPDTRRTGGAEILLHDDEFGGYLPIIVVNHKVTDPRPDAEATDRPLITSDLLRWDPQPDHAVRTRSNPRDQLRLLHLYRMMQSHHVASPACRGGVIGRDMDRIVVHDLAPQLADYDRRYADRLGVLRGQLPTLPSRVHECRQCPWWSRGPTPQARNCEQWLNDRRDVSVVATGARADVLRHHGVQTVAALAEWTGPPPSNWEFEPFEEAVVMARAWLAGAPLVRRVDTVRVQRAEVEVDVDLESYQEHGAYLWGTLLDGIYRPFVTWEPLPTRDEARSFAAFWTWLMGVRAAAQAAGKTFAAYCYSRMAEDKWLYESARRFAGLPGVPTEERVREFVAGPQWVDLFEAVSMQFICPSGKGLKRVAPVAGFHWRDPNAGGAASMTWYRRAVGYDGAADHTQRTRLLEYNEDDVRATYALREWMSPIDPDTPGANSQVPRMADFSRTVLSGR